MRGSRVLGLLTRHAIEPSIVHQLCMAAIAFDGCFEEHGLDLLEQVSQLRDEEFVVVHIYSIHHNRRVSKLAIQNSQKI